MITLLRRWYRWLFNPSPLPGQFWILDGIGRVRVIRVTGPFWYDYVYYRHVVDCWERRIQKGPFRSSGHLWEPRTLEDLQEASTDAN